MEKEKQTKEGRYLKGFAYMEMIAGVGLILFAKPEIAGVALLASGGIKYTIINLAKRDKLS